MTEKLSTLVVYQNVSTNSRPNKKFSPSVILALTLCVPAGNNVVTCRNAVMFFNENSPSYGHGCKSSGATALALSIAILKSGLVLPLLLINAQKSTGSDLNMILNFSFSKSR
jgi:hypothetical protein